MTLDKKVLKKSAVYLVFAVMIYMALSYASRMIGDDGVNFNEVMGKGTLETVKYEFAKAKAWNCRYLLMTMYFFLLKFKDGIFCRPFIGAAFAVLAYSIERIFAIMTKEEETPIWKSVLACAAVVCFPLYFILNVGVLVTPFNYVVPACFLGVAMIVICKIYQGDAVKIWEYILAFACLYIGASQEQLSSLLFGMLLVMSILTFVKKQIKPWLYAYLALSLIRFLTAAFYPGNEARMRLEASAYYQAYYSLGFLEKLYLGYYTTLKSLFGDYPIQLFLLSAMLCLIIFKKETDDLARFLGTLPMLVFGMMSVFANVVFSGGARLADFLEMEINVENIEYTRGYAIVFFSVLLFLNLALNIYLAFGDSLDAFLPVALFIGGICTKVITGMSTGLYISGERTSYALYLCMLMVTYGACVRYEKIGNANVAKVSRWVVIAFAIGYYMTAFVYF